jgi:hypothetical protein
MDAGEIKRREEQGLADVAAAALYHANRLPLESRWRPVFMRVVDVMSPRDPDAEASPGASVSKLRTQDEQPPGNE